MPAVGERAEQRLRSLQVAIDNADQCDAPSSLGSRQCGVRLRRAGRVAPDHVGAEFGELLRSPGAGWCGAARCPRCSGVKQNVTVTSNSSSASICRSNHAERIGPEAVGPAQAGAQVAHPEARIQRTASSSR